MKYLSLDLETTSLNPDPNHILMISMVVEDTSLWVPNPLKPGKFLPERIPVDQLPHFTCFIKHDEIRGQPYALGMNGWILDYVSGRTKNAPYPIYSANSVPVRDGVVLGAHTVDIEWEHHAKQFLTKHFGTEKITVAGKNVAGFDIPFLPEKIKSLFRHRCIDAGSLFINWNEKYPPDLAACKRMTGLGTEVAHDAREDAMDVISILRATYNDRGAVYVPSEHE